MSVSLCQNPTLIVSAGLADDVLNYVAKGVEKVTGNFLVDDRNRVTTLT
jgi:hypothetical protein